MCGPKDYQTIDEALDAGKAIEVESAANAIAAQQQNKMEVSVVEDDVAYRRGAIAAQKLLGDALTNGDNFLVIRVTLGPNGQVSMDGTATLDDLRLAGMAINQSMRAALDMFRSRG